MVTCNPNQPHTQGGTPATLQLTGWPQMAEEKAWGCFGPQSQSLSQGSPLGHMSNSQSLGLYDGPWS